MIYFPYQYYFKCFTCFSYFLKQPNGTLPLPPTLLPLLLVLLLPTIISSLCGKFKLLNKL